MATLQSVDSAMTNETLSPTVAIGLLVLYTIVYVLPLYGSESTRPSVTLSRDDPAVIRARMRSVRSSTAICIVSTYFILRHHRAPSEHNPLHAMGLWPVGVRETASCLLLTAILFAAPLYETMLIDGLWKDWVDMDPITETWTSLVTWRNIVVGPLTEELLFRSAAVPLFLAARMSLGQTIFLTPIVFGLAHFHHFYEFRLTHPNVSLFAAIARSIVQFSYTTLFGAYATFLFVRSGSLLAVFVAHAFCNSMGLPRFWGPVQPYWLDLYDDKSQGAQLKWTTLYYILLFVGAYIWWTLLMPLTESSKALATL